MTKDQLQTNEFIPYYGSYIDKSGDLSLLEGLTQYGNNTYSFLESISEDLYNHAYAKGKWTIKEVVQHVIDTERIFAFRALSFARKEKAALAGYEQDDYAVTSIANKRTKQSLIKEYKAVRLATLALFESFTEEMLLELGNASNCDFSVRALGFIIIGHENHHCQVIKERYL